MAVIKDSLQLKALEGFKLEYVFLDDMVSGVKGFVSGVFGVKEGQQVAPGLQHGLQTLHQGLHQGFREIVGYIPEEDRVELISRVIKVFREESRSVNLQ
jgi:ubiquinone biosynthesis protein UbiJ